MQFYPIQQMTGTDGQIGIVTVIAAIASFWILYDYPDTAGFLTPIEKRYMVERLTLDRDGCSHEYKNKFVKHALLDWKIWVVSAPSACESKY
jgi:sugar phosphate permease